MSEPLPPDPYAALGVPSDAELVVIRIAHRKLILKHHPDRIRDETQREKARDDFQKIQQAYEILSDPSRRLKYDTQVKLAALQKERMTMGAPVRPSLYTSKSTEPPSGTHPPQPRDNLYYEERRPPSRRGSVDGHNPWGFWGSTRKYDRHERPIRTQTPVDGQASTASTHAQPTRGVFLSMAPNVKKKAAEARGKAQDSAKKQETKDREKRRDRNEKQSSRRRAYFESEESSSDSETVGTAATHNWRRPATENNTSSFRNPSKSSVRGPENSQIEKEIKERNKLAAQRHHQEHHNVDNDQTNDTTILDTEHLQPDLPQKQPSKEKLWTVPVEQLGLVSIDSQAEEDMKVDIVAVHGLGAIPDITWKEKHSGINWLSDRNMLPKLVPQARIMRFGYDSLWMGKTPIRASLSTIAYKLLLCLNIKRGECLDRPLIFIGHCFGGLVIERALNLAKMQVKAYPGVCESSVGTVFLGTPHRGTLAFKRDSALLAAIAKSSDLGEGLEMGLLDAMASEDGTLLDVADDFVSFCRESGLLITCFFEQRTSALGKVIGQDDIKTFIVDASSATLDGHPKYGLELDHFGLNKFSSSENPHYNVVSREISRFYDIALQKVDAMLKEQIASKDRPGSSNRIGVSEEDKWKSLAAQQIYEEEIKRRTSVQDLRLRKNIEEEKRVAKAAAEKQYLDRLLKNLRKYGIQDAESLIKNNPLPNDKDLSEQAILEKDRWFKNNLKGILEDRNLDDGIIDEILNDTGPTMLIDGVESTYTKLSSKWISRRTLDRYEIPWMKDEKDDSFFIIKRWVPDYERAFLWDHSRELRGGRGRKAWKDPASSTKEPERLIRTQVMPKTERPTMGRAPTVPRPEVRPRRESYNTAPQRERGSGYNSSSEAYWRGEQDLTRSRSNDSVRSAPGYEEVARRRRDSRTLSGTQTPTSPSLQRQQSADSEKLKRASRDSHRPRASYLYRSDDEVRPRR